MDPKVGDPQMPHGDPGMTFDHVQGRCDFVTALNIEVDPQHSFCRRESDFDLQGLVECCVIETEILLVTRRWHSSGYEVRLGLPVLHYVVIDPCDHPLPSPQ